MICTGKEEENAEIAREYGGFLSENGGRARLVCCSKTTVTTFSGEDGMPDSVSLYAPEILDGSRLDHLAKQINHQYHLSEGRTVEEDWAACDYFSRLSCRASADYTKAFLTAAGISPEELHQNGWPKDPALLNNLGEMEHLRWCAFHYSMGYQPMSPEEFAERAAIYRQEKKEKGESRLRVAKDAAEKRHACLISWEELPDLDRREKELTGRTVNYQMLDIENVQLIPQLIAEERGQV